MLQLHLLGAVVVDLLHQGSTSELFLLPLGVALLPLPLGLLVLESQQLLLACGLSCHLELQRLCELHGLPLSFQLLSLLLLGDLALSFQDAVDEVLVKLLLHPLFLGTLGLLDGHVLICLSSFLLGLDAVLHDGFLLLHFLLRPQLLHPFGLNRILCLVLLQPLPLHVQLNSESLLLLIVPLLLEALLTLFTLDLGKVAFVPELGIEVVDALLLCFAESFVVQLEIPICDGLQLHDLGVHRPKVIYACPPLLVELLLDDRLPLVLSALLKLIRAGRHSLHPLCRCLFSLDHLFLPSLHLIGQLLCKLIPAVLQLGLLLRLHI
mmetsp:Transcript_111408/g.265799  ORF Transcript_111408/g.265799 Transcript_111408/m.265799 type:complete len:322 (+) Transcript_111408:485-1450(+)